MKQEALLQRERIGVLLPSGELVIPVGDVQDDRVIRCSAPCDFTCWVCQPNSSCTLTWGHDSPHICPKGHRW